MEFVWRTLICYFDRRYMKCFSFNLIRRLGMEESLFHRLMSVESTCTLQLQYRMNQALVDIANKVAYSQRLKCANKSVAESTMSVDEKVQDCYTYWDLIVIGT